jgi:hypothetical protein
VKLLLGIILIAPACLAQKSLHFSWTPGSNPGWTECTSGPYCLTGYTLYETTNGTPVVVASIAQTDASVSISPLPSKGSHTYELVQNGTNEASVPVQSTGNPGIVINCWKSGSGRTCKSGKSW